MNPFRAKKITDHFANIGIFTVKQKVHGINVYFRGTQVYFEDESALLPFLLYISYSKHHENIILNAD